MADAAARQRNKRMINGLYTWTIQVLHFVFECLPGVLRTLAWRPFLAHCGRGVMIDHHVYFKYPRLVHLGNDVSINRGAEFYPGMMQRAEIRIGDRVRIAPNVRFHAAGHDPDDPDLGDTASTIVIEDDAWIGASAIILPGVRVGHGAVVAAGAIVSRSVQADTVVAGVPARAIRNRKEPR